MSDSIWPYRWFGYWQEHPGARAHWPSIHAFRRAGGMRALVSADEFGALQKYLLGGATFAGTSRAAFPCLVCGATFKGNLCSRSDGMWLWRDDLVHYLDAHDVVIPDEFLQHIKDANFSNPERSFLDETSLQLPV